MDLLKVGLLALPANFSWTGVEVTDSDRHSSLLRYGVNYDRKKFYSTVSRSLKSIKSKSGAIL